MAYEERPHSTSPQNSAQTYTFGRFRLEADGALFRENAEVHLAPRELAALRVLLNSRGQIVSQRQLRQAIWGQTHVTADSIPKCLSSLRARLEPDQCIQTVYKRGYRLAAAVESLAAREPESMPKLAVLPFSVGFNVEAHLGLSIAEETIALLTADRASPARMLARDSVFTLAARGMTAQQVGTMLEADLALAGTLSAMPQYFRLRAEMIQVESGTQLWVEDMLVPRAHAAGLEAELTRRLFARLNNGGLLRFAGEKSENGDPDPVRREAQALYRKGHHAWQSFQRIGMEQGLEHLNQAVELDPALFDAHVDLAHAAIAQGFCGLILPAQEAQQVRHAAKAIPMSSKASIAVLPAIGWVRFHVERDLPGAIRAFEACAEMTFDSSAIRLRSMFALSRHRFEEAIELLRHALQSDPYSPWLTSRLAWSFFLAGDMGQALKRIEETLEIFPDHEAPNLYGSIILGFHGATERAAEMAEHLGKRSLFSDIALAIRGYALARAGRKEDARAFLERLQWLSRERYVVGSFLPALCVALGDLDGAAAELKAAADARCPWVFQMLADPRLEPLHGRPEFVQIQQILTHMEASAARTRL